MLQRQLKRLKIKILEFVQLLYSFTLSVSVANIMHREGGRELNVTWSGRHPYCPPHYFQFSLS
jgi:hypothetical protein